MVHFGGENRRLLHAFAALYSLEDPPPSKSLLELSSANILLKMSLDIFFRYVLSCEHTYLKPYWQNQQFIWISHPLSHWHG